MHRQLFSCGLTAFDSLDETALGVRPNQSYLAAQEEVPDLLELLKLPIDDRGRRRAAIRAEWFCICPLTAQYTRPLRRLGLREPFTMLP